MLRTRPARVLPVNIALLIIGAVDLATTVFWLHTGQAVEVNPVMAALLGRSMALFIVFKAGTLAAYVAVIEWYRLRRNAAFACFVSNVTAVAYLSIYAVSFLLVNCGFILR